MTNIEKKFEIDYLISESIRLIKLFKNLATSALDGKIGEDEYNERYSKLSVIANNCIEALCSYAESIMDTNDESFIKIMEATSVLNVAMDEYAPMKYDDNGQRIIIREKITGLITTDDKELLNRSKISLERNQSCVSIDEEPSKVRGLRYRFTNLFTSIAFTAIMMTLAYFTNIDSSTLLSSEFDKDLLTGGCVGASLLGVLATVINGKKLVKPDRGHRSYRLKPRK